VGVSAFCSIVFPTSPGVVRRGHTAQDDGSSWISNNYNRLFRKAVKGAKLPSDTVFYSLRHYHISKLLVAGKPAQFVAENNGTSIRMLEKHYSKFMNADRRAMMENVELGI